jgi:transcriptional regulator with XRE-family HTH domain
MAKRVQTYLADNPSGPDLRPKQLTKQEFGRRLRHLMTQKGWCQSDLARHANIARDSVSTYIRGISLPEPRNLDRLAKALDMPPGELLPNSIEAAIENDLPSLNMNISHADQRFAWLQVNRLVSTATCFKVVALLGDDVLPDRKEFLQSESHEVSRA